ncbi:MAG: DNA polymerase III subunit gamma/tau [Christensenellaceae bacterium]|jgi:DNA polymerase-3 subunit gamma/tau|nr:DNA polymerase III subunit gamma/tau [Christensenellaceae bacterium]
MSEMVSLYRKYRPKNFGEVVGQDFIIKTLENQIKNGQTAHAYLFCGTRGTGKTSVAKIFAREINNGGGELDIFELDAASNNSVNDVRELIDKVKFPPVSGTKKVYIIDEVHMFSTGAFNAFLKTLEEPPEHAIFILATTEAQKVPATIQSRCLRFDFRTVSLENLQKHLKGILEKEGAKFDDESLKLIAKQGQGSVRDMLSFADMVLAYSKDITEKTVREIIGSASIESLKKLLSAIKNAEFGEISNLCEKIFAEATNAVIVLRDFIDIIKEELIKETDAAAREVLSTALENFITLEFEIKYSNSAGKLFEATAILSATKKKLKIY